MFFIVAELDGSQDFGIAKILDDPEETEKLFEICGTPGYVGKQCLRIISLFLNQASLIAPEVYLRQGYTRKCDILYAYS